MSPLLRPYPVLTLGIIPACPASPRFSLRALKSRPIRVSKPEAERFVS